METDWDKLKDQWLKGSTEKGRREMPRTACGHCFNFRQNATSATGDGWCMAQKEGEANKVTFDNTDASHCTLFQKMERIRTDTSEFMWDTHFRPQRQFTEQ